jgi:hypothetical protein
VHDSSLCHGSVKRTATEIHYNEADAG